MRLRFLWVMGLALLLPGMAALAGGVNLTWESAPAPTPASGCVITKYKISYGISSGTYTASASTTTGTATALAVSGLDEGRRYYFAAQTVGTCGGVEKLSGFSNEVSGDITFGPPGNLKLSLSPVQATFSPTRVGQASSKWWSVRNHSMAAVTLESPAFDRNEFTSLTKGGKTIQPGAQARWNVQFKPVAPGWVEGRLALRSTDGRSEDYPLTGYGLP